MIALDAAGNVKNFGLTSRETIVTIDGAADVEVTATELLDVQINGAGEVRYRGNPATVNTNINGAGEVREG